MVNHRRINPPTLFDSKPFGFSQVVISEPGGTFVHCSGQVAWNRDYELVGVGDVSAQARESLRNVGLALAAAGAIPADVVRIHIYVVDYSEELIEILGQALVEFFGSDNVPASTLMGVQRLAKPEFLIEIEVTAVI
jgi:enamine deaminase RidA (YjgF/YER057c/UK114 family)